MGGARNLHRLAGTLDALRRDASTGPCFMCEHRLGVAAGLHGPWPQSVGWIEGWDLHPKGVCERHAEQGRRLGYRVHTVDELDAPGGLA